MHSTIFMSDVRGRKAMGMTKVSEQAGAAAAVEVDWLTLLLAQRRPALPAAVTTLQDAERRQQQHQFKPGRGAKDRLCTAMSRRPARGLNAASHAMAHLSVCFHPCNFTFWYLQEQRKGKLDSELAIVLSSISLACKQIAAAVGRSGISSLTGVAGTGENVQVRCFPFIGWLWGWQPDQIGLATTRGGDAATHHQSDPMPPTRGAGGYPAVVRGCMK